MPDFTKLLGKSAGSAKKPVALDQGDYPAIIKSHEMGESRQKKTPYVQYNLGYTGWPDGAEPQTDASGEEIDVTKKQGNVKFFLTEDAMFRLDDFLRGLGIDLDGKTYLEAIPEAEGMAVLVEVGQYLNQDTGETANQVNKVKALD